MKKETRIQQNGEPRTKGIRNAVVAYAMTLKGGAHKNKKDKRKAQKERRFEEQAG
jgi:hypothetical protein